MIIKEKLKKIGVPLLSGFVIVGSIAGFAGSKAFASTQQASQSAKQQVEEQTPQYTASIFLGQQDNSQNQVENKSAESENDAVLASKAKITESDAVNAVKAAYPQNTVQTAALGDENGYLVYEVKMTDKAGKNFEAKVDAGNAKVLAVDNGSEESTAEKNNGTEEKSQETDTDNEQVEQ